MSIPELNDDGLLPAGLHDCSIEDVQSRFGQYQSSDRRCRLYEDNEPELQEYIDFFAQVRGNDQLRKGMLRVAL